MITAVYPGSFDPLTNGHLDIIQRASKVFDEVIVLVSVNSAKKTSFSIDDRKKMVEAVTEGIGNVRVDTDEGLLVDYVSKIKDSVIVKGLRALLDFEYEFKMALVNRQLSSEVETVFLMTSMKYAHVSSSLVKEIINYGGDVSEMVPPKVLEWYSRKGEQ